MPGSPDQNPVDMLTALSRVGVSRGLSPIDTGFPVPAGPEISLRETLSRLPREVTSFKILGKSVGDLGKEAIVSGFFGALFRIGLGSAGVGGIALGATAGAGVAGVMEIRRQAIENQQAHPERMALKEKLKSLNPHDKKRLVMAIGRGAVFGAAGGIVGGLLADTPVGQAVKEGFSRVGELKDAIGANFQAQATEVPTSQAAVPTETPTPTATATATPTPTATEVPKTATALPPSPTVQPTPAGTSIPGGMPETPPTEPQAPGRGIPIIGKAVDVIGGGFHDLGLKAHEITGWGLDVGKTFVDHSAYFKGRVEITDSSPEWIKSINSLDGEYGKAIQGTVGESLPDMKKKAVDLASQIARERGLPDYYFRQEAITNYVQHIMEDAANRAFDSQLQQLVAGGQDLNQITDPEPVKELGKKAFQDWLNKKSTEEIMAAANSFFDTENQIDQILQSTPGLVAEERIVPASTRPFDIFFPKDADTNIDFLRKKIPDMAANIAANESDLTKYWFHREPYPAYLGELTYLMQRAEAGDMDALHRLKDAYKSINKDEVNFKLLTPEGVKKVLEILRQLR